MANEKIVLAHDYLTQRGGAERVALEFTKIFPDATLYTSVYASSQTYEQFNSVPLVTSVLQKIGAFRRDPRRALPLLGDIWNRMESPDADIAVCSTSGWSHAMTVKGGRKIAYCHNPPRWLYQEQDYGVRGMQGLALRGLRQRLIDFDQRAASTVDRYIANSTAVAQRIEKTYGITPRVIFPPTNLSSTGEATPIPGIEPGYYLNVSRKRGYKNTDIVASAVSSIPGARLLVVGGERPASSGDANDRVAHLGIVSESQLRWLYANARALVTVAFEDFGLTPVEANLFGTPVIALRRGGHLDTVSVDVSGAWIEEPTIDATRSALATFEPQAFDPQLIREHAEKFSPSSFRRKLLAEVEDLSRS